MRHCLAGLAATAVVVLAFPAAAQPQQDMSKVEIETTALRDGTYMLTGSGGNIGLSVGEDGVLMIDDQFAPLTERILAAIAKLSDEPVKFLINTHWHNDHTGGNENIGKTGAVIIAQDNVYKRLSVDQFVAAFNRTVPASPKVALPVVTFSESATLHVNGDTINVVHTPHGHTDGDVIIYFVNADVLHMGDNFFNGMFPFIDLESGGGIDGMIASEERGLEIAGPDTKIIPGHGPLATRADLQATHDMLADARGRVAKAIADGKSFDDILAAKPLAYLDASWSGRSNSDAFTKTVYDSLMKDMGAAD